MAAERRSVIGLARRAWSAAPVATVILVVALLAAGFLGVRSTVHAIRFGDPQLRVQAIEPWMTPGYLARAWDIPRAEVIAALGIPDPAPDGPIDLRELAALRGVPLAQVIAEAEALVAPHRQRPGDGDP